MLLNSKYINGVTHIFVPKLYIMELGIGMFGDLHIDEDGTTQPAGQRMKEFRVWHFSFTFSQQGLWPTHIALKETLPGKKRKDYLILFPDIY